MGEYYRVFPYFNEPLGETKYKEELISPIVIENVTDNLFIVHFPDPPFF